MDTNHIELLAKTAANCHAAVNQTYGGYLPYEFHLRLTASYASRYMHALGELTDAEQESIIAAAYFHDTLEDARLTYNDLVHLLEHLKIDNDLLINIPTVVEAVYALTNDKGRNRAERAGERYYAGIRATRFAPYVKMCDRLANLRYSTLFHPVQRMAKVYAGEMQHFLDSIGEVPSVMVIEARRLLAEAQVEIP